MLHRDSLSTIDRAVKHWAAQDCLSGNGVSAERISEFEKRHGVALPADMRAFYGRADGMLTMDSNLMRVWSIDELKPIAEEHPSLSTLALYPPNTFVICDWSIWCHAYAMTLSADPARATPIVGVTGTAIGPSLVAESWTEFLKLLLANAPALYF